MITDFDREILTRTDALKPEGKAYPTVAYIVWRTNATDNSPAVEMGPVRWVFGAEDTAAEELTASASPFPGAWVYVKEFDILAVRHPEAM